MVFECPNRAKECKNENIQDLQSDPFWILLESPHDLSFEKHQLKLVSVWIKACLQPNPHRSQFYNSNPIVMGNVYRNSSPNTPDAFPLRVVPIASRRPRRRRPYSVVVLDEIEKAHAEVRWVLEPLGHSRVGGF